MKNPFPCILVIFCTVLGITGISNAEISYKWSEPIKQERRRQVERLIGKDETGIYVLTARLGYSRYQLEKYDLKYNPLYARELVLETPEGKDLRLHQFFLVGDQLMMFTSYYNRKLDKNIAFVNAFSKSGTPEGGAKVIDEIISEKKRNAGSFDFAMSADSQSVLIYHNEPYEKHAQERFGLKVINSDLEVIWKKNIKLNYTDKEFTVSNYTLGRDNKVYMLARVQSERRDKKDDKPTYQYTIISMSEDEGKENEYNISLGDKFITTINFELDQADNIICMGFYSNNSTFSAAGAFYLKIDNQTEEVVNKSIREFEKEDKALFLTKRELRKDHEISNFKFRKLIPTADGAILLAEEYYVHVVTTTSGTGTTRTTTTTYYYYYNDVMAIRIDKNGEIAWIKNLEKYQVSTNDNGPFSSFATLVEGNNIHLIYNDNEKNGTDIKFEKGPNPMTFGKRMMGIIATINEEGRITKTQMLPDKDKKFMMRPKLAINGTNGGLLMPALGNKAFMIGEIKAD